jgi:hypothetical protein
LPCGTSLGCCPPCCRAVFFLSLRVEQSHLPARQFQVCGQLLLAPKAVAACVGLDLGSVQRYPLQRDQSLGTHHPQQLHEQVVQCRFVIRAKARQPAVADRLQPAQPLASRLVLALPRQFARRTCPTTVRVNPQADQQMRSGVLSPGAPFDRLDLRVITAQAQPADQLPDQTCAVIFVDQLLDINAAQCKLLSIDGGKSRYCRQALVAHIRSLPM